MSFIKNTRIRKRPVSEINVVPYIDVMLVLLVIFMITAPLLSQGVHVKLPQTKAKTLPPKKDMPIVVSVNQAGQFFLNISKHPAEPISAQALISSVDIKLQQAKKQHKSRDIYVKGDRNANYGQVMRAMVLLQKAGAKDVGLITKPTESKAS